MHFTVPRRIVLANDMILAVGEHSYRFLSTITRQKHRPSCTRRRPYANFNRAGA